MSLEAETPPDAAAGIPRVELRCAISTIDDAPVARALVLRAGLGFGFDRVRAFEIALATSELVRDMAKHGGGELIIELEHDALVVTALERSPGAPERRIPPGRGTGGGVLSRLCDEVLVSTRPGGGAIISCRKHRARARGEAARRPDRAEPAAPTGPA